MINFDICAIVVQVCYLLDHGSHDFGLVELLPANLLCEMDWINLLYVMALTSLGQCHMSTLG